MSMKSLAVALGLLMLAGCTFPVRQQADAIICADAVRPSDLALDSNLKKPAPPAEPKEPAKTLDKRLLNKMPGIPGAEIGDIEFPKDKDEKDYLRILDKVAREHLPPMPALGVDPTPIPGPDGKALTLADLQRLARANSPLLRQAAANVEAAKGAMVQAGLYSNPTFSLQNVQTPGPGGGPMAGATVSQTIKTMGKVSLSRAMAEKDLESANLAYRRANTDLMYAVRTAYFAVLVSQESIRANRALARLTDEVYNVMIQQFKGGQLATYEPMQLGVFAVQVRASLVQARNSYTLAWKQLASALGLPAMSPTEVAGWSDMPLPIYRYDAVLAHVLANHTDVLTTAAVIDKARYNLRLAQVTPITDVMATVGGFYDNTQGNGPYRFVGTLGLGLTLPIWDRNQGGIRQAQAGVLNSIEEPHRVRNALTASVADAFRRYDENRVLLNLYVKEALPKQVQAFRGTVKNHYGAQNPNAAFTDLISAEQNLVSVVGAYLTILSAQWQAVVDVANLLQTDDIFQVSEKSELAPATDLECLLSLPCCHPCSGAPGMAQGKGDVNWHYAGWDQPGLPTPKLLAPEEKGKGQQPPSPRAAPGISLEVDVSVPLPPPVIGPRFNTQDDRIHEQTK